jgi:hypothetical protein
MMRTVLLALCLIGYCFSQCIITVPSKPLSAAGLATPYLVSGCDQTNFNFASFVQGAVIDTTLGSISVYNPLIINQGTTPAITPTAPTLPTNNVVGLWFGSNAGTITLKATTTNGNSLTDGVCVNGNLTPFGQFAYCNAVAFFQAANTAIAEGLLVVPPIGIAVDFQPCPTLRDYFLVDMDQSDNVDTTYLLLGGIGGKLAQNTAANAAKLGKNNVTILINPSDNRLLNAAVGAALGCSPWTVPDLADPGSFVPALPLNELQAAAHQAPPLAIIPALDPMVLENGQPNLKKINLYRAGVNQPPAATLADANTVTYCQYLQAIQLPRLANNAALFATKPALVPVASNLYTFLASRFQVAFSNEGGLTCTTLLNVANPITVVANSTGFVTAATITLPVPPNPNCALIVPNNPLTATGLSTPFQLVALNAANGPCHQNNTLQASFVQGAVINLATGQISIYNPLVIDKGSQPAAPPVVPTLPTKNVVGLWFGSNAGTLTLQGATATTLANANCVNGDPVAGIFGQFAYCNAVAFFQAANNAINNHQLVVPPLGTALDGNPCLTVRDFALVDMDQSDNVVTNYLVTSTGQIAQNTALNRQKFSGTTTEINGSDNTLLAVLMDGALGCTPWKAPDLADPGAFLPALPLNELQAARLQGSPQAKVPKNDPMTVDGNGVPNLNKLNAYRVGVNQAPVANVNVANTTLYCQRLGSIAPTRFLSISPFLSTAPSPAPLQASNLFTFIASRFMTAFGPGGLNCTGLLNAPIMINAILDHDAIMTNATVDTGDILPYPDVNDTDSQPDPTPPFNSDTNANTYQTYIPLPPPPYSPSSVPAASDASSIRTFSFVLVWVALCYSFFEIRF